MIDLNHTLPLQPAHQIFQQRPKDLPTLSPSIITNCNNLSPLKDEINLMHINNASNNANWNSDSWADGEFEPIDEPLTGNNFYY